jgi:hypothetical protein
VAEVQTGETFCLSLPLDQPVGDILMGYRYPPVLRPTVVGGKVNMGYEWSQDDPGATDVVNDDLVVLHLQASTQWDSLAHVGYLFDADGDGVAEPVYYNGFRQGDDVSATADVEEAGRHASYDLGTTTHVSALGIENMAQRCVQGRGVMVDLHAHFGRAKEAVGYADLMRVLADDAVQVEEGDVLCLHTGFAELLLEQGAQPDLAVVHSSCTGLDSRDARLLRWITESGVAAIVADNFAVELVPVAPAQGTHAALPLHEHCLFKLGAHLGELWHLTPLADRLRREGRSRFLLTAPPLRLPGAIGSPVTPVATI